MKKITAFVGMVICGVLFLSYPLIEQIFFCSIKKTEMTVTITDITSNLNGGKTITFLTPSGRKIYADHIASGAVDGVKEDQTITLVFAHNVGRLSGTHYWPKWVAGWKPINPTEK